MKKLLTITATLLLLASTNVFAAEKNYGTFTNVTVLSNYDGDTLTVNIPGVPDIFGEAMHVRVAGIDTPEMRGKCDKERQMAEAAKEEVYIIVRDYPQVTLHNMKRGKYFRVVADVETSKGDLATILLDKGLAVPYNGGTKEKNWCE